LKEEANSTGVCPPTAAAPHGKYDEALRPGVTHWHVLPDVFVGADHPRFIYAGLRADAVRLTSASQDGRGRDCLVTSWRP
jgi:hypothetical protein